MPAPRRNLFLRRPRPALGDQADQVRAASDDLEHYKAHVIDQAVTILNAGHEIRCMFTTPKLLEALAEELENRGTSIREMGITGIFAGGTEFTPQFTRFAMEELLGDGVYMTPTYGNTLMGLACSKPVTAEDGYKISYYAPQPRAVIEVVSFDDSDQSRGLRRDRPRATDHADEGDVHSRFSGKGRRRAGAAVREISVGRRERRAAVSPARRASTVVGVY